MQSSAELVKILKKALVHCRVFARVDPKQKVRQYVALFYQARSCNLDVYCKLSSYFAARPVAVLLFAMSK